MKVRSSLLPVHALSLAAAAVVTSASAEPDTWAYFGCIGKDAPGVYVAAFDSATGELGEARRLTETQGSSFLTIAPSGDRVYVIQKSSEGGSVGGYTIDSVTGDLSAINTVSIGSKGACHVCLTPDGATAATADYGGGMIASYAVGEDGSLSEPASLHQHEGSSINERRQTAPHAHCTVPSPDGQFIMAADLGTDEVFIYRVGDGGETAPNPAQASVKMKPGGGSRHFAFHPNAPFAYGNLELTSEVTVLSYNAETGQLSPGQVISTLPEPVEGNSTSELLVHSSGDFLYCANRGHNSIAAFAIGADDGELTAIGHASCGGEIPRNFGISHDGGWIVTCNQASGNAGVLKIGEDGPLTTTEHSLDLPTPMCVRFIPMGE